MQSTHEMYLDHLSLVAKGTGIPGFHRTIMMRKKVFGRLPFSGHCTTSRLKHIPSLPVKRPIIYSGASDCGKGFMFPTYLEAIEVLLGNINRETPFCVPPWPCYSLVIPPSLYAHLEPRFLQLIQGTPPDFLAWRPTEFLISAPLKCIYFHTLKAAA